MTDTPTGHQHFGADGMCLICGPVLSAERPKDPEAENAVAQAVMAYGQDDWLPLHLRYGIADDVLDRLHRMGYRRAVTDTTDGGAS